MKTNFTKKFIITVLAVTSWAFCNSFAQTCEWQLVLQNYSAVDPDGAGPATGSASFTLQLRSSSGGNIPDIGVITTGFSYQSSAAMVPTNPGCATVTSPANITVSPEFAAAGFVYETVFQCNVTNFPAGAQTYNRTAAGSLSSNLAGGITLTTQFKDVFTVTLWTLGAGFPQGGYVMIRSGTGVPGGLGTYGVFDNVGGDFPTTSLTYETGLALGGALPVLFTNFDAKCSSTGNLITWATAQEDNSSSFEIERSTNGSSWSTIGSVPASGTSSVSRNYQQIDLIGGTAFYRIKQLDKNGQAMYSGIARTNCPVKNISSVIYPVPASDVLNVVIKSDKTLRTQLMVYDMHGKLVKKLDATVLNGNNNFRINLQGLPSGDYMLRTNDAVLELNKIFTIAR